MISQIDPRISRRIERLQRRVAELELLMLPEMEARMSWCGMNPENQDDRDFMRTSGPLQAIDLLVSTLTLDDRSPRELALLMRDPCDGLRVSGTWCRDPDVHQKYWNVVRMVDSIIVSLSSLR